MYQGIHIHVVKSRVLKDDVVKFPAAVNSRSTAVCTRRENLWLST